MSRVFRRSYRDRKTGKVRRTSKYYGCYTDADGIRRRVALFTDKVASEQKLAELQREAVRRRSGLSDRFDEHARRPLVEHLAEFRRHLQAKNNTERHVALTLSRIEKVFAGCEFRWLSEVSPSAVEAWLAEQRGSGRFGIVTANAYVTALKSFGHWLKRTGRTAGNPFESLTKLNPSTDIRRERRALTNEEFRALLKATGNGPARYGLSGQDRAALYVLGAYTGLRAGELASLTSSSFDFESDPPTVTVEAAYSKHRRRDVLPLHPAIASRLRDWLQSRSEAQDDSRVILPVASVSEGRQDARLWPAIGSIYRPTAKMLREDLQAAGVAVRDDDGRIIDFHSLRHTFISNLAKAGVHPKLAQALARHSTITLTLDRYSHIGLLDMQAALNALPEWERASECERATGTDDFVGTKTGPLFPKTGSKLAHICESRCDLVESERAGRRAKQKSLPSKDVASDCERMKSLETEEPPVGLEPTTCALRMRRSAD